AQELAAEEQRRAEQARRRRNALLAMVGEHIPERIAAGVAGQLTDAGLLVDGLHQRRRGRDLAPDEGALALHPEDLLGLDAEDAAGRVVHQEGRRVVIVTSWCRPS